MRCITLAAIAAFSLVSTSAVLAADKKYDPGASDTEIKIGNIMPYSGPASSYGVIGKTEAAFFKMINEQGGINGRSAHRLAAMVEFTTHQAQQRGLHFRLSQISPA